MTGPKVMARYKGSGIFLIVPCLAPAKKIKKGLDCSASSSRKNFACFLSTP